MMFDRDSGRGILLGGMIRNHRIAEHNRAVADDLEAQVKKLRARIAKLEADATTDAMRIAGLEAQREAFMKQHPDSPLLQDSGKRFKDGDVKTRVRLIYEAAFDAMGRKLNITNPAAIRQD